MSDEQRAERLRAEVKEYYREAAVTRPTEPDDDGTWGASRYETEVLENVEAELANSSMGCGNPFALAELEPGETVLDLGSGGGLDVILSARRVGPTGKAYGLDFLDEMIELGQANAAEAQVTNVEFLHGDMEHIPLPDASIDVVLSNCVINLAPDKAPVFAEIARVLKPGGRMAISDVVAEAGYQASEDGNAWANCGVGALERSEYLAMLGEAGLVNCSIEFTHQTSPGLHGASVRAQRP